MKFEMTQLIDDNKIIFFNEITEHLLNDPIPSEYMNQVSTEARFKEYPFQMLLRLKETEQSKKHHPEGNAWNHTMMVVDEAAKVKEQSKNKKALLWAALLHDIGKPDTTKVRRGRITSYDHDKVGEKLCRKFLQSLSNDDKFIDMVCDLVRYHMHILYILKELPYADPKGLIKKVDIHEIALLCRCDRLGRIGVNREEEEDNYSKFLKSLQELNKK